MTTQLSSGARIQDYVDSLVSLHGRFVARVRTLHEMKGAVWSDAWIDEYWPPIIYGEGEAFWRPSNFLVGWALKLDAQQLYDSRFDDSYRSFEARIRAKEEPEGPLPNCPPSASLLLRVIAACVTSNIYMLGVHGWFPDPREFDWTNNPLYSDTSGRHFVNPETRAAFGNDPWVRVPILESLIGAAFPCVSMAPVGGPREIPDISIRRCDARLLNWLHRAMDILYLVKIPKGARRGEFYGTSFEDRRYSYEPTVVFRQYNETQALAAFEWPWYHPEPGGGREYTTREPSPVSVHQTAWRVWEYPEDSVYPDPWTELALHGETLESGHEAHGWYYRYNTTYQPSRQHPAWPPLDRRHAVWRQYALPEGELIYGGFSGIHRERRYAEVDRSWYRSTLADMELWDEVADIVEYWEWKVTCEHSPYGRFPITFRFQTSAESHTVPVIPGQRITQYLRFTTSPVEIFIEGGIPGEQPFCYPWRPEPRPWDYPEAITFCDVEQDLLPDLVRDIRPWIGETPPA